MVRFHDLDALRGFAMLLGVLFHASAFLVSQEIWPIQDPWAQSVPLRNNPYAYMALVVHGFRMPLFFLLSGFFTAMLWRRRGVRALLAHRLRRIGLPLFLGAFTIIPLNEWLLGHIDLDPWTWSTAWTGSLSHLWFLWHLLLLVLLFTLAVKLGVKFHHGTWWLLIPLTALSMFFMEDRSFGADSSPGMLPKPNVLVYHTLFFLFGAFLYQQEFTVHRRWGAALVPALAFIFPMGVVFLYPNLMGQPESAWTRAGAAVLQAGYTWLMNFGMMGLFRWLTSQERFWIRYLSDASYWMYLWHLSLVIMLQGVLADLAMNAHLKFLLLCLVVSGILLLTYELGVRYTWIGTMLNGRRTRVPQG